MTNSNAGSNPRFNLTGKRVWVAGHRGLAGSAICRRLAQEACRVLTVDRQSLDLRRPQEVEQWLEQQRPDVVVLAAARVGGILPNDTRPAEFIYDNLAIQNSVIHGAYQAGVKKLMFLGSSCIYPRMAPQPMGEEVLLTGPLEPTNQWYAIAKIAGLKLCQAYRRQYGCDFIAAMPANLYGPGDNYNPATSHAPAALIRRVHFAKVREAPELTIWGTGNPRRELLYVDDLADAIVFLLQHYSSEEPINVGSGEDVSIRDLAERIARAIGYRGRIVCDPTKPDGMPRRVTKVDRINQLGWRAQISFEDGLARAYHWFLEHAADKFPDV